MKAKFTVNPRHGDYKFWEKKECRQVIQFMRCDLSNLASDIKCYLEIRRVGISDEEIEWDRQLKEDWKSLMSEKCDRIAKAARLLDYNICGK